MKPRNDNGGPATKCGQNHGISVHCLHDLQISTFLKEMGFKIVEYAVVLTHPSHGIVVVAH